MKVLVSVRAAALNPIDYKKAKIPILGWYIQGKPAATDFAGIVTSVGPSAKFKSGDEVFGFAAVGSLASTIVADDSAIAIKPRQECVEASHTAC